MACKKYGCRLLTGLPNPAVIIVTNDGTNTRERDRAELVLDYTLGSGLRSHFILILLGFLRIFVGYPLAYPLPQLLAPPRSFPATVSIADNGA